MIQSLSPTSSLARATQLRREAAKARELAAASFGEHERRQLIEIAVALERESVIAEAGVVRGSNGGG